MKPYGAFFLDNDVEYDDHTLFGRVIYVEDEFDAFSFVDSIVIYIMLRQKTYPTGTAEQYFATKSRCYDETIQNIKDFMLFEIRQDDKAYKVPLRELIRLLRIFGFESEADTLEEMQA